MYGGKRAGGPESLDVLVEFATAVLVSAGASVEIASAVAHQLADSELAGRPSHGLRLLKRYVDRLQSGEVSGTATPSIVSDDGGPILRIAGNRAFGQVVGDYAAEHGVARARQHGVSVIVISSAGHLGRNARWPEYAAQRGVASIHFVHGTGHPQVVPFGASEARMRTNPIALGAPSADGNHVIIDFSVAEVSGNRVTLMAERGERLESRAIMLPDGTLTDDPVAYVEGLGALLPFGGFKGYGIAVFAEILGGVITGENAPDSKENRMLSIYLDVARLTDFESYGQRLAERIAAIRSSRALRGTDGALIPGDRSRRVREGFAEFGFSPSPSLVRSLREAAATARLDISVASWAELFKPP